MGLGCVCLGVERGCRCYLSRGYEVEAIAIPIIKSDGVARARDRHQMSVRSIPGDQDQRCAASG
jgi:hypothetical protein